MAARVFCCLAALALALAFAACGGEEDPRAPAGSLTVFLSAPGYGPAAAAGGAVLAGARRALRDAGGRAGGRRVRLIGLSANRPGDPDWDPGTVEGNAKRAADDPRSIAYLGEVDGGASAISLPRTNQAGLLQVSPADGLTSLTRSPPGPQRVGPARYYPAGHRTFLRMVPSDLYVARAMVRRARPARGRRIAVVETADVGQREMGGVLAAELRRSGSPAVAGVALRDSVDAVPGALDELAEARPDVVLLAGAPGPVVTELLAGLRRRQAGAELVASPQLAGERLPANASAVAATALLPALAQPASGRRLLRQLGPRANPAASYGYDAMRVILDAVSRGRGNRRAVVRAALRPRRAYGRAGAFRVRAGGEVERPRLALVSLTDGRAVARPAPR